MEFSYYDIVLSVLRPIQFGTLGISFLVLGLTAILTKRPFLISGKWWLLLMLVSLGPMMLFNLIFFPDSPTSWVGTLLSGGFFLMMWYQLTGYVAFAVTDTSFREALFAALQKLQLPYEESLSVIRLTSIEVDLQVSVQSWIGMGNLKAKQKAHHSLLKEVANAMNEYYRASSVSRNVIFCVFLVVAGAGFVGFTIDLLDSPFFQGIF
jgi:hypothetical protein